MRSVKVLFLVMILCLLVGCGETNMGNIGSKSIIKDTWEYKATEKFDMESYKDLFCEYWHEKRAGEGNTINDIIVLEHEDDDISLFFIADVNLHVKESYNSDGSMFYEVSKDVNDEVKNVVLYGGSYLGEEYDNYVSGSMLAENQETAIQNIVKNNKLGSDNFKSVLNSEERKELITKLENFTGNIYGQMEELLKAWDIEGAKNLYYKTTDMSETNSRKCLLLYAKYRELYLKSSMIEEALLNPNSFRILSYSINCREDDETSNENDYVISFNVEYKGTDYAGRSVHKETYMFVNVTLDVNNKTYEVTDYVI